MEALNEKAIEATARFLERKGCEVIDRRWEGPEGIGSIDLVAVDDGELVFVDVVARRSTDGFPEAHIGRELREILAAKWLGEHGEEYCNAPIRFDDVAMMVMGSNRALLRHHVNCFGTPRPAVRLKS